MVHGFVSRKHCPSSILKISFCLLYFCINTSVKCKTLTMTSCKCHYITQDHNQQLLHVKLDTGFRKALSVREKFIISSAPHATKEHSFFPKWHLLNVGLLFVLTYYFKKQLLNVIYQVFRRCSRIGPMMGDLISAA